MNQQQAQHDRRIDYIEFPVPDIAEAKRFYGEAFGWSMTDYGPDYTSFNDGRLSGGFRREAHIVIGGPLVVVYAADLESVREQITEAGGQVKDQIHMFPGGRRFHFVDPFGHELAVWSDRDAGGNRID